MHISSNRTTRGHGGGGGTTLGGRHMGRRRRGAWQANLLLALRVIEQMTDEELDDCLAKFLRETRGESAQGTAP